MENRPEAHAMYIVDRYARRTQMSPFTQLVGLIGFLGEQQSGSDPAAAADGFLSFLKHAKLSDETGVDILCQAADWLKQNAAFLKYFEAFTDSYEAAMRGSSNPSSALAPATPLPPLPHAAPVAPVPSQGQGLQHEPPAPAVTASPVPPPAPPSPADPDAKVVNVPIPIAATDWDRLHAWLHGRGEGALCPGQTAMGFDIRLGNLVARVELTGGPAGPALDTFITDGKRSWTAKPVYELNVPAEIKIEDTTYHVVLVVKN